MENKEVNKTRIALVGIIVEDLSVTEQINEILHMYAEYIIGRMGIPYRAKNVSVISVVIDAPQDIISSLAGKLGMLRGANVKVQYTKK